MKTKHALAVCVAYIKEISDNDNVYGLGKTISLSDLDALVKESPAQGLINKIAGEIAESEVERRIGEWLAIEVDEDDNEVLTEEAQELYDEAYGEAITILTNNLINQ